MDKIELPEPTEASIKIWCKNNAELEGIVGSVYIDPDMFEDRYDNSFTDYYLEQMIRAHLLREIKNFNRETQLHKYIACNQPIQNALHFFSSIPSQYTFWRAWNLRFTKKVREFIRKTAELIIDSARENDVPVPHEAFKPDEGNEDEWSLTKKKCKSVSKRMSNITYSELYLKRSDNSSISEEKYFDMTTKMGMHGTAANSTGRTLTEESSKYAGDNYRNQLKKLSIEDSIGMFDGCIDGLIKQARRNDELDRFVTVAIDITVQEFYGDKKGHEDEILGTKESNSSDGFHYATIQIVDEDLPLVLGIRPVKKGNSKKEIVSDLLDQAEKHIGVFRVLMDREFDSQDVLKEVDGRGIQYLVPKRKMNSEKETIRHLNRQGVDCSVRDRKLHLGGDEWIETKLIYVLKDDWDGVLDKGHENMVVFMTNRDRVGEQTAEIFVRRYRKRWGIENGYKRLKKFLPHTSSKDFSLRFFYFMYACLLYNSWRIVDVLVALSLDLDPSEGPIISFDEYTIVFSWIEASII